MARICVYYIKPVPPARWFKGDHRIRLFLRSLLGKKERISSLEMVFLYLCMGFDKLKVDYVKNPAFRDLRPDDIVIMLGHGKACLKGYDKTNPVVAGISLMSHPKEWPDLFEQYPVKVYLQHSDWAANIYRRHFGDRCDVWPVGIDTAKWQPDNTPRDIDVLVYNKILIDKEKIDTLLAPVYDFLKDRSLKFETLRYGSYKPEEFMSLLRRARSMLFFCEHESQGIAYQEAMSMDVPIFAWEQGKWLDPNRSVWENTEIEASSVPYFDPRCGRKFKDLNDFYAQADGFWEQVGTGDFKPREYVLENLTLEISARKMLDIINKWVKKADEDIADS